jgi:hypothetical protein
MLEIRYQRPDLPSVSLELTEVKGCSELQMKYMVMKRNKISEEVRGL